MIDKRYLSSLNSVKNSRITAERLLAIDPTYYDAHLAAGIENYLLSLKPAPMRWFLQMAGGKPIATWASSACVSPRKRDTI